MSAKGPRFHRKPAETSDNFCPPFLLLRQDWDFESARTQPGHLVPTWCPRWYSRFGMKVEVVDVEVVPRDPITEPQNGFMEPKYLAFRRWLYTPIILGRSVIGSLGSSLVHHEKLEDEKHGVTGTKIGVGRQWLREEAHTCLICKSIAV